MKRMLILLVAFCCCNSAAMSQQRNSHYVTNRAPLIEQPYSALPLGAIKPHGMLREMLDLQAKGLTGNMDTIFASVCGSSSAWIGGKGDHWERGPYWVDGLLPLAYILDDDKLKAKALKWVNYTIDNQREDGYIGPKEPEQGEEKRVIDTQPDRRTDWWTRMVMLKILQQYYNATNDERALNCLTRYFKYQLSYFSKKDYRYWSFWAQQRAGDNLSVVYWLYNITGDKFLLELGEEIYKVTQPWDRIFTDNTLRNINPYANLHCVNVAQGIKAPVVYYQQNQDEYYKNASREGLEALRCSHGYVTGMYGGDEHLHGNDPSQGIELCAVVELMYSLESVLPITGDIYYADYLEKVAYNSLPTQSTDDYMYRQYFQQVNQVEVSRKSRNFFNDGGTRVIFGRTSGNACCFANMHQGWPKFVQNLWYATADNGVAALIYGASEVEVKVGESGKLVKIVESTDYPFRESVNFEISTGSKVEFPLHLRVPAWCSAATIKINGKAVAFEAKEGIAVLNRTWANGDKVSLNLPMKFKTSRWHELSIGVERGPLVYALRVEEEWREVASTEKGRSNGYWEVYPTSAWNYGISDNSISPNLKVDIVENIAPNPWNLKDAPISVKVNAKTLNNWELEPNGNHSKIYGPIDNSKSSTKSPEQITLIPYGCTTIRVAQFPALNNSHVKHPSVIAEEGDK